MRFVGLDLSTKTGLVIIDELGNVLTEKEITSKFKEDPQRMIDLTEQVLTHLKKDDIIAVEGFSYGSRGRGVAFQYGYGYSVQISLYKNDFNYLVVTPSQVKKFATGLGNANKESMILPIYKRWGYEHESDNVRDAFILAQIARATISDVKLTKFQKEVIDTLKKGGRFNEGLDSQGNKIFA